MKNDLQIVTKEKDKQKHSRNDRDTEGKNEGEVLGMFSKGTFSRRKWRCCETQPGDELQ